MKKRVAWLSLASIVVTLMLAMTMAACTPVSDSNAPGYTQPQYENKDAPAAIADLSAGQPNIYSVVLSWTAPGNKANKGTAQRYDIRYSEQPIDESNWDGCALADVTIYPRKAGEWERFQVNELEMSKTYYFAIKTINEAGLVSDISNIVSATAESPGIPDEVTVSNLIDLQEAIDSAPEAGRIITLAKGTYQQTERIMIQYKNNITIQGETDNYDDTVLIGPGINDESMYMNMKVISSSYCTIKNLTLQDSYYHAVQIADWAHYFRGENLKMLDNGESGIKTNMFADYGTIENCYIGFTTNGMRSVIEGIDGVGVRGWVVRGNTIENIIQLEENIDLDVMPHYEDWIGFGVFFKGNSQDCLIEDNLLLNCDVALSMGGSGTGSSYYRYNDESFESRREVMRNNVVWGTIRKSGIYINSATEFEIYNNIIWDVCGTGSVSFYSPKSYNSLPSCNGKIYDNILRYGVEDGDSAYVDNDTIDKQNNTVIEKALVCDENNHAIESEVLESALFEELQSRDFRAEMGLN